MEQKHGLNQYRLNRAKDHARYIAETVAKVEMLYHLSAEGHIDESKAENGIKNLAKEINQSTKELLAYIEQRED